MRVGSASNSSNWEWIDDEDDIIEEQGYHCFEDFKLAGNSDFFKWNLGPGFEKIRLWWEWGWGWGWRRRQGLKNLDAIELREREMLFKIGG